MIIFEVMDRFFIPEAFKTVGAYKNIVEVSVE